jgi:hypothetical protein
MKITFKKDIDKKYLCSVCDKQFKWGVNSYWFGSYSDLGTKNIITVCSKECKEKAKIK